MILISSFSEPIGINIEDLNSLLLGIQLFIQIYFDGVCLFTDEIIFVLFRFYTSYRVYYYYEEVSGFLIWYSCEHWKLKISIDHNTKCQNGRNPWCYKLFTHRWYHFTLCRGKCLWISVNTRVRIAFIHCNIWVTYFSQVHFRRMNLPSHPSLFLIF